MAIKLSIVNEMRRSLRVIERELDSIERRYDENEHHSRELEEAVFAAGGSIHYKEGHVAKVTFKGKK